MIKLSLIIATYNRAENLRRTLGSLTSQSISNKQFEIVVVNNNSTDHTADVGLDFAAQHPELNFKMIFEPRQGLSYARNSGIEQSVGHYLAIIDDDEEVNREFVESYVNFFDTHPQVAAAGGAIVPLYEYEPPKWLTSYIERPISAKLDMGSKIRPLRNGHYPIGGNMGFRRSALDKYGLFDPNLGRTGVSLLGGEEKDLFMRLRSGGQQIYYIPTAIVTHIIPESRFAPQYFDRLMLMVGRSERMRTKAISVGAYRMALLREIAKWCATIALAAGYTLCFTPSKGKYLIRMRRRISGGLLGCGEKGD